MFLFICDNAKPRILTVCATNIQEIKGQTGGNLRKSIECVGFLFHLTANLDTQYQFITIKNKILAIIPGLLHEYYTHFVYETTT